MASTSRSSPARERGPCRDRKKIGSRRWGCHSRHRDQRATGKFRRVNGWAVAALRSSPVCADGTNGDVLRMVHQYPLAGMVQAPARRAERAGSWWMSVSKLEVRFVRAVDAHLAPVAFDLIFAVFLGQAVDVAQVLFARGIDVPVG